MHPHQTRIAGVLLSALIGSTLFAATSAAGSPVAAGSTSSAAAHLPATFSAESATNRSAAHHYSVKLADRMNVVRRHHGLRPLRVVRCLNGFAGPWARRLARTGAFYHQDLQPIVDRCALSSVGEIIARGRVSPQQMIRMWLDSPEHRELLLEPSFRIAGVAGRHGSGAWVGCIDFGRRRSAA